MLPETKIHFQHRIVKMQFSFCRGAAQFNKRASGKGGIPPLLTIEDAWCARPEHERSTMKYILILLFALAILESRAVAGLDNDIPQTNRVVLSSGRWKPSAEETQKALAAIQTFLESPSTTNEWTKREIKKILEHTKEYRVQFVGVVRDGKRLIWCNFFRAADAFGADWKREEVRVMDGGFWFWQIEYDPSAGKCLNFGSNGYA